MEIEKKPLSVEYRTACVDWINHKRLSFWLSSTDGGFQSYLIFNWPGGTGTIWIIIV